MHQNPFNHSHFIGYINQVSPQFVKIHFPSSVLMKSFSFYGEDLKGGLVGSYVVIEGEKYGFLGKILELSLPENERLELSEKSFNTKDFHPTGKIEILISFDLFNPNVIDKGLNSLPLIGSKVFICSSEFIKNYFKGFGVKAEHIDFAPIIKFGKLTYDKSTNIELSQQALFSRHCAVVGTTGGGKSYTVSKLIEGIIENKGKAIVIDPTGEYSTYDNKPDVEKPIVLSSNSFLHYTNLTITDLFVLLRPSGQVQAPKLLEAIKSLKIYKILQNNIDGDFIIKENDNTFSIKINDKLRENIIVRDNTIVKASQLMRPFNRVFSKFIGEVENLSSNFDINFLSAQIARECVYDIDFNNHNMWGTANNNHATNCISLLLRINNLVNNTEFDKVFGFIKDKNDESELINGINNFFLKENRNSILRIGFENVSYDFQAREILAKESRKYGLFLCIATQMPRDIPIGTLSQVGTFISHRLINHQDKEAIANACSSANRDTLSFLPTLGAGEAILMGVDFPMPVMLKVDMPVFEPNSSTPLFK